MPVWITIAVVAIALVIGIYFMAGSGSGKRSDAEKNARLSDNQSNEPCREGLPLPISQGQRSPMRRLLRLVLFPQ